MDKPTFETNRLYLMAREYIDKAVSNEEIRGVDVTDDFWIEVEEEIRNGEIVVIQLIAKPRMSKSTTGIYIGQEIHERQMKFGKIPENSPKFGIKNIARDQQEYSKLMRDPDTFNTVIVTDESNELEDTGENVTVERALNNSFSNVQAGRYVHRVNCSPRDLIDPNTDIILESISVDKKNKITHCYLYYRLFQGGVEYRQLVGYVDFDVSKLVKNWLDHVIMHFMKKEKDKTEEDRKVIEKWRKRDFYVEYMIRKYEKMEIITREGIMKPRTLDYAGAILEVIGNLKDLTRLQGNLINRSVIRNYVKLHCRERKIPLSIIGEDLMTSECEGVLNLWKSYFQCHRQEIALTDKLFKLGRTDIVMESQIKLVRKMEDELLKTINAQMTEFKHYEEVNNKYNGIYNGTEGKVDKGTSITSMEGTRTNK